MENLNLKISIVIPTLNRISALNRTFSFISKSSILPDETIVVDQSPPETANKILEICRIQPFDVKYIHLDKPSSTKARNVGFDLCQNEIVLFMDDDVDVGINTFKNLLNIFADNSISLVGGIDDNSPAKKLSLTSLFFFRSTFSKRYIGHIAPGVYGVFPQNPTEKTPTEWAMGFFFAIRRSLAKKWNMQFDENLQYYAYAEDLDYTYRYFLKSKSENLHCIISTLASVKHNVSNEYRFPKRKTVFTEVCHRTYILSKYSDSILRKFALFWANLGLVFLSIYMRHKTKDAIDAIIFSIKFNRDIKKGNFHYEKFI